MFFFSKNNDDQLKEMAKINDDLKIQNEQLKNEREQLKNECERLKKQLEIANSDVSLYQNLMFSVKL